ncbi:MAG: hypothetical protein EAZ78_12485 [Oscillatoriales cyanobacterium]|nr:MAG: hypothetical protein EA000_15610 [Oscillatoriales cyanobacterium]TAD95195.1 MAG: hypothetical protein EAZ98_16455 [Oscillatoriales cyanobacterium]TAE02879.1 MAG: hypothetical protein EAZ96_14595 [Oscillatoriales cyanobacterium]TAF03508.1 MAG: hypothetical protein EAZ78_12485 [Oscillatoriales cyanobacterium]TAF33061.1 MAG: hypothetical protein EAZ68_20380 [Oscillatoriales cyanobacterium]
MAKQGIGQTGHWALGIGHWPNRALGIGHREFDSPIILRSCTILNKPFMNRQDACSTRKFTLCGTGILPVADIGARSQIIETFSVIRAFLIAENINFIAFSFCLLL